MRLWLAIAAGASLAAAGAYGPGGLADPLYRELGRSLGQDWSPIPGAVGGPVWWLRMLPGMSMFRYPAKWMPIATLGVAVATSLAVDHFSRRPVPRPPGWAWAAAVVLAIGLVTTARAWLPADWPADAFWGPAMPTLAARNVQIAVLHVAVVIAGYGFWASQPRLRRPVTVLILLLAIDLAVAHVDTVPMINRSEESRQIADQNAARRGPIDFTDRDVGGFEHRRFRWPNRWREQSAPDRLVEVEAALRAAEFGRWHLTRSDRRVLHGFASVQPAAAAAALRDPSSIPDHWGIRPPDPWWSPPSIYLGWIGQLTLLAMAYRIKSSAGFQSSARI